HAGGMKKLVPVLRHSFDSVAQEERGHRSVREAVSREAGCDEFAFAHLADQRQAVNGFEFEHGIAPGSDDGIPSAKHGGGMVGDHLIALLGVVNGLDWMRSAADKDAVMIGKI